MDASVIVPTYKEAGNLSQLTQRLFKALGPKAAKTTELIFVDDNSRDGSVDIVNGLQNTFPNVRIVVRTKERGLSSAVLAGFAAADASSACLVCMDADLQHPPEKVPNLIAALSRQDFVIGTRYAAENAIDKDWPLHRRVISAGARALALPLTPLSDPMTGFFGVSRRAYARGLARGYDGVGFKVCLEVYVKAGIKKHDEVPIVFGTRAVGESKLSGKVVIGYLIHLGKLYWFSMPALVLLVLLSGALLAGYILRFLAR